MLRPKSRTSERLEQSLKLRHLSMISEYEYTIDVLSDETAAKDDEVMKNSFKTKSNYNLSHDVMACRDVNVTRNTHVASGSAVPRQILSLVLLFISCQFCNVRVCLSVLLKIDPNKKDKSFALCVSKTGTVCIYCIIPLLL